MVTSFPYCCCQFFSLVCRKLRMQHTILLTAVSVSNCIAFELWALWGRKKMDMYMRLFIYCFNINQIEEGGKVYFQLVLFQLLQEIWSDSSTHSFISNSHWGNPFAGVEVDGVRSSPPVFADLMELSLREVISGISLYMWWGVTRIRRQMWGKVLAGLDEERVSVLINVIYSVHTDAAPQPTLSPVLLLVFLLVVIVSPLTSELPCRGHSLLLFFCPTLEPND